MAEPRTVLTDIVAEKTTCRITAAVVDEAGLPLAANDLTTLTLTLYVPTGALTIINSRNGTNILNAGPGQIDANGILTLTLDPLDNAILDATLPHETHRALVQWTWSGGNKSGRHEVDYRVRNLAKVS